MVKWALVSVQNCGFYRIPRETKTANAIIIRYSLNNGPNFMNWLNYKMKKVYIQCIKFPWFVNHVWLSIIKYLFKVFGGSFPPQYDNQTCGWCVIYNILVGYSDLYFNIWIFSPFTFIHMYIYTCVILYVRVNWCF